MVVGKIINFILFVQNSWRRLNRIFHFLMYHRVNWFVWHWSETRMCSALLTERFFAIRIFSHVCRKLCPIIWIQNFRFVGWVYDMVTMATSVSPLIPWKHGLHGNHSNKTVLIVAMVTEIRYHYILKRPDGQNSKLRWLFTFCNKQSNSFKFC